MQIKRLAALSLAAILATTMLTACPWEEEDGNSDDDSQIITDGNRPGHDIGDTDSGSDNEDDSSSVAVPDYIEVKDPSGNITGYNVSSPTGLQKWAEEVKTTEGLNCTLTNDINVSNWTSVPSFTGNFDGAGHEISGLDAPLFSSVGDGTVQNVTLELTATFSGVGGVTESLVDGTIQNCTVTGGSIDGDDSNAGGIAGKADGNIINCIVEDVHVTGKEVGGIAGTVNRGTIEGCMVVDVELKCDETAGQIGGIAGMAQGGSGGSTTITGCCFVDGTIVADGEVIQAGGIAGSSYDASVTACYWSGTLSNNGEEQTSTIDWKSLQDETFWNYFTLGSDGKPVPKAIIGNNTPAGSELTQKVLDAARVFGL